MAYTTFFVGFPGFSWQFLKGTREGEFSQSSKYLVKKYLFEETKTQSSETLNTDISEGLKDSAFRSPFSLQADCEQPFLITMWGPLQYSLWSW